MKRQGSNSLRISFSRFIVSSPSCGPREPEKVSSLPSFIFPPPLRGRIKEGGVLTSASLRFGLLLAVAVVFALAFAGCTKKGPPLSDAEVKAVLEKSLPSTVEDKVWEQAPLHTAKLILQDIVEPRLIQASTSFINVQSVTDGRQIAFLLSWSDATMDDLP